MFFLKHGVVFFSNLSFMEIFAEDTENECIIISEVIYCGCGSQLLAYLYRNNDNTVWNFI